MSFSSLALYSSIVGVALMLSRILGFLRNSFVADIFGQNATVDMYNAAFLLPDAIYLILVGGAVSSAFVPVIASYLHSGEKEESWRATSLAFNIVLVGMSILLVLGFIFTPSIIHHMLPGFTPPQVTYTSYLGRIMLGAILFHSLNAVLVGASYAHNSFWAPSIGPLVYNVVTIVVGVLLAPQLGIVGFAVGVLFGAFINFLIQLWGVLALRPHYTWGLSLEHPGIKRMGKLMLPVMLGLSLTQLNLILNQSFLASYLARGTINALTIGSRIMLVPVSFATSLGIPLLPALTAHAAKKDLLSFRTYINQALRAVIFVAVPASIGLILLAEPVVRVLFEHGRFSEANTMMTAQALIFYSIGIVAYSGLEIVERAYFALGNTSTPVRNGIVYLVVGNLLNFLLLPSMGFRGLALSYSLAGILNLVLLLPSLRRRLGGLGGKKILATTIRTALASSGMGLLVAETSHLLAADGIIQVAAAIAVGVLSYSLFSIFLGSKEVALVRQRFFKAKERA